MDKSHGQIPWRDPRGQNRGVFPRISDAMMLAVALGACAAFRGIIKAVSQAESEAMMKRIREEMERGDDASSDQ